MNLISTALPQVSNVSRGIVGELSFKVLAGAVSIAGIVLAWFLFLEAPGYVRILSQGVFGVFLHRLWLSGWGFDRIYNTVIVRPFVWAAKVNKDDFIDLIYLGVVWTSRGLNRSLAFTQTGKVRWYAAGIAIGAALVLGCVVFL
jgi:NADH-quinone oxidoreductase subunit L